jgi:hypothetical protein
VTDELRRQIAEAAGAAVAQAIGPAVQAAVQTAVAPIVDSVREFKRDWQTQDQRASDSRSKMYERLGAMETQTAAMSVHVQNAGREVSEVKAQLGGFEPRLRAVESFRNGATGEQRGVGKAMTKLRNIATVVLAIASAAAAWYAVWRGAK